MSNACNDHYKQLHAESGAVLAESFAGSRAEAMAKSHAFIGDLGLWIVELGKRPEVPVLQATHREYQFALLALSAGHYRAAFSALRLTLELGFAAVQWSANERELREWLRGQRDTNWLSLIDAEKGILSKQFVLLFSESLADEAAQYRSAAAVYRECSEYVHGNAHTHRSIPEQLTFDDASFEAWQKKASVVRLTISYALAARYLCDFDAANRSHLENTLMDQLGHSGGVRALLGGPSEVSNG
ncbi:MAG TPA: hypothetical protein PKD12_15015 [Nitrospira sp.]|nr:hypothetical protein [Nitrospira sp.]